MKAHGYLLYIPSDLYVGLVKLQADKGLGRVYPALYALNEGLFNLGYISKEIYEIYQRRYSEPLIKKEPLSKEQKQKERKLDHLNTLLGMVAEQWNEHTSKEWREQWIKKAEKYPDLPNAKEILALAEGRPNIHG